MQYLVSVIDDTTGSGTASEMAAIDGFNEKLRAAGHWIYACGLAAPASAVVFDNRGGAAIVRPGPFLETREYLSGFWIVEAADGEMARNLAAEASRCCNRKVELRPMLD